MTKKLKVKLIVAHAKCINCGFERTLYFLPNNSYGERIVSTNNGEHCAYANLLEDNIIEELTTICKNILNNNRIFLSTNILGRVVSNIYPITCDNIAGMKISSTAYWKCPICLSEKIEEDKEYGEQLNEMEIQYVSHDMWQKSDMQQKIKYVEHEMKVQGYIN